MCIERERERGEGRNKRVDRDRVGQGEAQGFNERFERESWILVESNRDH